MPTQTYDFNVPSEYTTVAIDMSMGYATLAPTATTGTILCNTLFKGIRIDSFVPVETVGGGTIGYGLEVDTVLRWHNGTSWTVSDGTDLQLNTLAQLQANLITAIGVERPIVKPFIRLTRPSLIVTSPSLDDLAIDYSDEVPNRQVMLATDPAVALDTGVGGVPSPGQTRVTLDPLQVAFTVGADELWIFLNGLLQPPTAYIEEDSTHVVFNYLLDVTVPGVDEVEFRSSIAGTSMFIPPPVRLSQARPLARPDNFGGNYEFV